MRNLPVIAMLFGCVPAVPCLAERADVDLALVLAADVSSSMNEGDLALQRQGYVAAFRHPDVVAALTSGPLHQVSVTYVEWGAEGYQRVVVPWTVLDGRERIAGFAAKLARAPLATRGGHTSISGALRFAAGQFADAPVRPARRTIDVSGDGVNNDGPPLESVRRQIVADGVTINGLSIGLAAPRGAEARRVLFQPERLNLQTYFESAVIGGPGAFVINADGMGDFATAIRRKLVVEIAERNPAAVDPALVSRIAGWLAENFDLPMRDEPPHIAFAPAAEMGTLRYRLAGEAIVPGCATEIVSLFDKRTDTIYLPDDWSGKTPAEVSMLVHEMVHYFMAHDPRGESFPGAGEQAAYEAQDKWLALSGESLKSAFGLDRFSVLMNSVWIY